MNTKSTLWYSFYYLLAAIACFSAPGDLAAAPQAGLLETASEMVRAGGSSGGICAVVGRSDADLALALARQGSFVVHCLSGQPQSRDRLREAIRSEGMYGAVSADLIRGGELPYTNNVVNIVVVDSWPELAESGLAASEVIRVLAPLGTAFFGDSTASKDSGAWREKLAAALGSAGFAEVSVLDAAGTWVRAKKPWPAEIDQWTHYLHGPDGNPVARDTVVGPPEHYQWIAEPMFQRCHETDSSVSTLVTAEGRLFAIVDEAPISLAGQHSLPDKWSLVARDAFNGVLLWKVPIRRWGWREWKDSWFNTRPGDIPLNIQKRLVAVGDRVYVTLGYQAPVSQLDARTGQLLKTYDGTERTAEILYLDGTLILSMLGDDGARVMAVDAESGTQLWVSNKSYRGTTTDYIKWKEMRGGTEAAELDPTLNMAADGAAVALIDGPEIVCLDRQTGHERWRAAFPQDEADLTAGGIQSQGNLWVGTMIVHDGVVLHASPHRLAAFSADSGELLWAQPKRYIGHLWYEWKDVFVIDGTVWTWSDELAADVFDLGSRGQQRTLAPVSVKGYELKTGELEREVPLGSTFKANHHHRCYRNKATLRYILASRRGTEFVDLAGGPHSVNNWVRGTCHVGMMPANGLHYAPPHPCQCYIDEKLNGMNALAAARDEGPGSGVQGSEFPLPRLERGPAYGKLPSPAGGRGAGGEGESLPLDNDRLAATPGRPHPAATPPPSPTGRGDNWPAFRHDAMRTGSVDTQVPDDAAQLWRVAAGQKVSPPIVVGDRLFAALVDEHHVVCLNVNDGGRLWEFAAGGRIDSPPTYHEGTVLFGSADGWVYCLRAGDGQLAWRFRAAPEERLIAAFGQLESAWPVHGSVLVQNGMVYFAAGRTSQLDGGIYLYALDAASGELLHERNLSGPRYTADDFDVNFGLPMGMLPDVLMSDGEKIYMRSSALDAQLNPQKGGPQLQTKSGLLDGTYFKRMPWTFGGDYARLIVHDSRSVCYVRMFDTLRGLDPTVYFTPGSQGYLLFAKNVGGKANTWSERIPIRIRTMVLTPERLLVAGPPDVVDPKDPLGAFEGRKGGVLSVIDASSGEVLASRELASPPVFNGACAAEGRLYVCEEDGHITCFGKK